MDIIRLVEAKTLLLAEKVLEVLHGGCTFQEFEAYTKKQVDQLGAELLTIALEAIDQQQLDSSTRKQSWTVVRRNDRKEILTLFGQLSYSRTYYQHKQSKEYCYLVDEKAGIPPHTRVSPNMKAELVATCGEMSYEKATRQLSRNNPALKVSKQTASNYVKDFQTKPLSEPEEKRRVDKLYIEADEDHLKVKGRRAQARLIYCHEGVGEDPRRNLTNARYFTTVQKKPGEFWLDVLDYLDAHYDLDSVQELYLSGDGASWIKAGRECFPDSVFILDKFHLAKAITSATGNAKELKWGIYRGIRQRDKQHVMKHLAEALELAETEAKQKRVLATVKYIDNNWDEIVNGVENPHVGCSAEGHVSHILSDRLSSRPMAWSQQGAEKMALIRSVRANGESVQEHCLAMNQSAPVIVELKEVTEKALKHVRQKKKLGKENLNNAPIYSGGSNLTRRALKGLNSITAV